MVERGIENRIMLTEDEYGKSSPPSHQDTDFREHASVSSVTSASDIKPALEKPWYYIDTNCISDKCSYMVQEMRFSCHLPFLITIFTSYGLSTSQAGLISGTRLIGTITGNIFWGMLADKTKKHKSIMLFQVIFAILLFCSQPFVSLRYGDKTTNQCPLQTSKNTNLTQRNSTNTSFLSPTTSDAFARNSGASAINQEVDKDSDTSKLFWILLFMNIGVTFCDGFLPSLLDVAVMKKIAEAPYKVEFGTQRKFGTLGYAIGIVITNSILDSVSFNLKVSCVSIIYAIYAGFILLELLSIYYMYSKIHIPQEDAGVDEIEAVPMNQSTTTTYLSTLWQTCSKFSSVVFFITVFIDGMQLASKAFFVITFLKERNASSLLQNLFFVTSSVFIFVGLEFSGRIIQLIGGTWNAFILVMSCYCIKFLGLIALPNVWALLITETLDFVCQGIAIPCAIIHVQKISPDIIKTSMFALMNSMQFGFGFIFASIVGGFVYQYHGGVAFYSIQATISLTWALVLLSYRLYVKLRRRRLVTGETNSHEMHEK